MPNLQLSIDTCTIERVEVADASGRPFLIYSRPSASITSVDRGLTLRVSGTNTVRTNSTFLDPDDEFKTSVERVPSERVRLCVWVLMAITVAALVWIQFGFR